MATIVKNAHPPAMSTTMTENSQTDQAVDQAVDQSVDQSVMPPDNYYAGLIDAQLTVSTTKNESARAVLTSQDPRVAEQISIKFRPTRITIIKRPNKADQCTILFTDESMESVLQFAAEHCVMKRELAIKTLEYIKSSASVDDIKQATTNIPNADMDPVDIDWAAGFFDARGTVNPTVVKDKKKKRGSVKFVLPKSEKFVIPALQRVLQGRVKKNSPCRLVYDTKETIKSFVETIDGHVYAKKTDFCTLA